VIPKIYGVIQLELPEAAKSYRPIPALTLDGLSIRLVLLDCLSNFEAWQPIKSWWYAVTAIYHNCIPCKFIHDRRGCWSHFVSVKFLSAARDKDGDERQHGTLLTKT